MIKLYIASLIGTTSFANEKIIHELSWRIVDKRAMEKGLMMREVKRVKKPRPSADEERRTRAKVGQQDERKKYRLDESLSLSPHSSLLFPPVEQCAEKCAIGEKNGPLPLWSSGPLELFCFHLRKGASYSGNCAEWISVRGKERKREKEKKKERKSETGGRGREGAFTTSGLDFFSLFCPAVCYYISSRLSTFLPHTFANRYALFVSLTVPVRTLLFLVICHGC